MKREITAKKGAQVIGPYSQGISFGNLVFISGNIGKNPKTGKFASAEIIGQTKQILENIKATLESEGLSLKNVLKTTVYLKDMKDYPKMNEVYGSFFKKPYPARATIAVSDLPGGAIVEIECMAYKNSPHQGHGDSGCCGECC